MIRNGIGISLKICTISCLVILLLPLLWVIPFEHRAEASTDGPDIRVALFVDMGTHYRNTVPVLTLSSETGMLLSGSGGPFERDMGQKTVRFSLDRYFLDVALVSQASQASQISHQLNQNGISNMVIFHLTNHHIFYRIVTTGEATVQGALNIQQEIHTKLNITTQLRGPHRIQAGERYTQKSDALTLLTQLQGEDRSVYLVQVRDPAGHGYEVWVDDQASIEAQAEAIVNWQSLFPGLQFQVAQAEEYLIHLEAPILSGTGGVLPHVLFSPASKVTVHPVINGTPGLIEVEQRFGRSYRGAMELSSHHQKLSMVNILPLEHYLYSVVGTEMFRSWPLEALKVQAIMSRNYAHVLMQGNKYGIAHLSDTVFEQAYHGFGNETERVREAVHVTRGEYLTWEGQVFPTYYYSNAGGMTADGTEVWGFSLQTHLVVSSPDVGPLASADTWYRVQDKDGKVGYVHSDFVNLTSEMTSLGFVYGVINTPSLNYRSGPSTDHPLIGSLKEGDRVLVFEQVKANNAYSWISGPFNGTDLQSAINQLPLQTSNINQPVSSFQVVERGPSGRVMRMLANGIEIMVSSPDAHRSVFRDGSVSLRSTRFEIEEMGTFHILGGKGARAAYPNQNGSSAALYTLSGSQGVVQVNGSQPQFTALNRQRVLRVLAKEPTYRMHGNGFGHGLGASQWGIYGLAIQGYDYKQILQHYFNKDAQLEKKY